MTAVNRQMGGEHSLFGGLGGGVLLETRYLTLFPTHPNTHTNLVPA